MSLNLSAAMPDLNLYKKVLFGSVTVGVVFVTGYLFGKNPGVKKTPMFFNVKVSLLKVSAGAHIL